MKRNIALILALVMTLTLLPTAALAAPNDKLIALTFDDGPYPKNTQRLLDGLKERGAHCTFFLVGYLADTYPGLVQQMWEDGHQIASHTYDHPYLTKLTNSEINTQLSKSYSLMNKALGFELDYMLRPPYGDFNDRVLQTVNVPCFYWSMDTLDWKTDNADNTYREFIKQAKDGSLVLLHDSHASSVTAALRAIDTLQAQGYEFVTVSELFYRRGISLQNAHMYYSAYPGSAGTADGIAEPVVDTVTDANGLTVTITGDARGKVYYTLNGETPNPDNAILYTGPFKVEKDAVLKAQSVLTWNALKSEILTTTIEYSPAPAPVLSIENGILSMSNPLDYAEIHYTVDGSDPHAQTIPYSEPFAALPGTTYRAVTTAPGYDMSPMSLITYTERGHVLTDMTMDSWCIKDVDRALSAGIFKGVTETTFVPNDPFSRAMLVTVLYRMAGEPSVEGLSEPFTDITEAYWCYDALLWAYNNGIIQGYEDGTFRPRESITRQALCAMLARYLRYSGKDLSGVDNGDYNDYADREKISPVFREDVYILTALGIVQGYQDGTIRPQNGANRGQAATMIIRMLDVIDLLPDVVTSDVVASSDPATSVPTTSDPAASVPTTSEPETSVPGTSEPSTSVPTSSDPVSTEPVSTEPSST